MILTQKQMPLKFFNDNTERCHCPFCEKETIGEWENQWLAVVKKCCHFIGFAQGHWEPTAMYKGVSYQ